MGVIEEIWKKNIFSQGDTEEKDAEISHVMEMFTKNEGILERNLTGENLEAFRNAIEWQEESTSLYEYIAFRDGFKAGVRLGIECNASDDLGFSDLVE